MKVYERIVAQELPPLDGSVMWLNTSISPAELYHFNNGKWRAITEINFSEVAKQGDNKDCSLSDVCNALEEVTEPEVSQMWGASNTVAQETTTE